MSWDLSKIQVALNGTLHCGIATGYVLSHKIRVINHCVYQRPWYQQWVGESLQNREISAMVSDAI